MANTSFKMDDKTQEMLRILGISFVTVFRKGLVAYGIEGRIKDPRVQNYIKKQLQDHLDEMEAERIVLENLIKSFDKNESDVQNTHEIMIQEITERPEHISPSMAQALAVDNVIPVTFVKNVILTYLKPLNKYNGNVLKVKQDLEGTSMEESDRAAWGIVSGRLDIEDIIRTGYNQATREENKQ